MGAAFGRMIGEAMHLWFPEGVRIGGALSPILPGTILNKTITFFSFMELANSRKTFFCRRRLRHCGSRSFLCRFDPFDFHLRRHFGNDGPNSPHHPRYDCRFGSQRHFDSPPTVSLRFNHHDQETALLARHYLVQQWYVSYYSFIPVDWGCYQNQFLIVLLVALDNPLCGSFLRILLKKIAIVR
jgi:hypothetical protein